MSRAIWHTQTAPRGINKDQRRLLWRTAEQYTAAHRLKGCQGPLTHSCMKLLHALLFEFSGAMYPDYETLAELAGISESSVGRGIAALKLAGFLTWAHRLKREGQRIVRSSNAYTLLIPDSSSKVQSACGPQNAIRKERRLEARLHAIGRAAAKAVKESGLPGIGAR